MKRMKNNLFVEKEVKSMATSRKNNDVNGEK